MFVRRLLRQRGGEKMDIKETFYDQFWDREIDNDELNTILFQASQYANSLQGMSAFQSVPKQDARTIALSIGVTRAVLERYENFKDRQD